MIVPWLWLHREVQNLMEWLICFAMLIYRIHKLKKVAIENLEAVNPTLSDMVHTVVMQMRTTPERIIRFMVVYSDYRGTSRIAVDWKSFRIEARWHLPIVEGKILPISLPRELGRGIIFSDLRVIITDKKDSPL